MQSLQFLIPGKVWGIGHDLDAVLPFTCYSYWFSCYFDHRGKLMKALIKCRVFHKYGAQLVHCIILLHCQVPLQWDRPGPLIFEIYLSGKK
jgi:hypothetical protein